MAKFNNSSMGSAIAHMLSIAALSMHVNSFLGPIISEKQSAYGKAAGRFLNQRQRRKLNRQVLNGRK